MTVAPGAIDVRGDVPGPVGLTVRPARVNALLGTDLTPAAIVGLLAPLGIEAEPAGGDGTRPGDRAHLPPRHPTGADGRGRHRRGGRPHLRVRPDRPADAGLAAAGTPDRLPTGPPAGRRTCCAGSGPSEAWTATFVSESDQVDSGFEPPYIEVTNPLVESERFLRSSMAPGLIRAVVYNTDRRQGEIRLFEVGSVFIYPEDPPVTPRTAPRPR